MTDTKILKLAFLVVVVVLQLAVMSPVPRLSIAGAGGWWLCRGSRCLPWCVVARAMGAHTHTH